MNFIVVVLENYEDEKVVYIYSKVIYKIDKMFINIVKGF